MRCGLDPAECISHHWLYYLPGTKGTHGHFKGPCPVCGKRCLSLSAGVTTVLYRCHRKPRGCSPAAIRTALTEAGLTCLPSTRHRKPSADQFRERILRLLAEPISPAAFRLKVAIAAWECDAQTAADKLGIPRSTYYRLLASPKNETEPQVRPNCPSLKNETDERSTTVSKMGRHRRSESLGSVKCLT
jgi:hypothetical protein